MPHQNLAGPTRFFLPLTLLNEYILTSLLLCQPYIISNYFWTCLQG